SVALPLRRLTAHGRKAANLSAFVRLWPVFSASTSALGPWHSVGSRKPSFVLETIRSGPTKVDESATIVLICDLQQPDWELSASTNRARVAQLLRNSFAEGLIYRPKKIPSGHELERDLESSSRLPRRSQDFPRW